jgi:hypothetical protein
MRAMLRCKPALLGLALSIHLGGCNVDPPPSPARSAAPPAPAPPPASARTRATVYTIEGARITAADEASAAREHAARILPCGREAIVVRPIYFGTHHSPLPAYVVDGCGQRVVYVPATDGDELVVVSRFGRQP